MRSARQGSFQLFAATVAACGGWYAAYHAYQTQVRVSFARDVAPIGYAHCAPCHRPGQTAPFALLEYEDYRRHGRDIADVVSDRYMPPWKPHDRNGAFLGQRTLTDAQIETIRQWVDEGMVQGELRDLPQRPVWPSEWPLGQPDALVRLPEPYSVAADGSDEYRNFVIPSPIAGPRYVVAWDFKPGNRAVHHAILKVDRMGKARRADKADPGPGFAAMEFDGAQAPDGFYLVWAPGKSPRRTGDGTAWRIDDAVDLVLQLHLQPTGHAESIAPEVALYLSDEPPERRRLSLRIGDVPIDLAPGVRDYRIHDSLKLPAAVQVLGMFPHAHYLAKRMRVYSRLPDGSERELLRIDDWDFNWQDEYSFASPPLLPEGSSLEMDFTYDNSASNARNPSVPPVRVQTGTRSIDEMGNVTFQLLPANPAQHEVLLEAKYRRAVTQGAGAEAHYNLANALSRQAKHAEAEAEYRHALAKDPQLTAARFNLAGLLLAQGRARAAIEQLEQVIATHPDDDEAHLALGRAYELEDHEARAIGEYSTVLARRPGQARAERLLEQARAKQAAAIARDAPR